jgi:hypothetical protein
MIPRAFAGSSQDGSIYRLDDGFDDAGNPILVRLQTNPMAPGGASADHSFDWLRITLTSTMAVQIMVTPIVDGIELADARFAIPVGASERRKSQVFERVIRISATSGRTYAPRGTWLSVRLDVEALGPGDLIIDSIDVDYDLLTPLKQRV